MGANPDFRFIQKESPSEKDCFDLCNNYVFFIDFIDKNSTKRNRLKYIGRAEKYEDVFAIKFYASRDRKSPYDKYSLAHGQFGVKTVLSIFWICITIINDVSTKHPDCSFVIKGSEAYDPRTMRWEDEQENQRFRIYRNFLSKVIVTKTFAHYQYLKNSIYLLVRKSNQESEESKRDRLIKMLYQRFNLLD